ncbi:sugar-binding domain-containing protein [Streptococcus sp.]|uniref:sugar-binding domain-containing protein n=1 Tax=Streptococcus sp. TaxID=1306 RepID=UPI002584ADBF|nr:sugar-binding domain-containing protein [Streptococcus sp.]
MAKKAYAFGGLTSSLPEEKQARLQVSPGGTHFLKLIAQGDTEIGLRNLCGTDLESHLDDSWTQVDLPHDWKVALPYEDNPINLMAGSKPDGVAYYRKRFAVTENARLNKRVILHFEGVSRFADIWLNGAYLGHNNSGYNSFSFDVSEMLYYGDDGENNLLVKADTTDGSEGWWYLRTHMVPLSAAGSMVIMKLRGLAMILLRQRWTHRLSIRSIRLKMKRLWVA